jgi:integrase
VVELSAFLELRAPGGGHDPAVRGLRDAWETIIVTGRRCSEVLGLRLDCLGRYGGLPMLWHDQTKVGNYDVAIRVPERVYQLLETRQDKTIALFTTRHNRPPSADERARLALFPTNRGSTGGRQALTPTRPGIPWPPACCGPAHP